MFYDRIGWHRQHGSWRSTLAARYGPPPPHTVIHLAESGLRGGAGGDRPAAIERIAPCLQAFVEGLDALYEADMGSEPGQIRAVPQQTALGPPPRAQPARASNMGSSSPVTSTSVYYNTAAAPAANQPDEGYESSSTTGGEASTDESASNANANANGHSHASALEYGDGFDADALSSAAASLLERGHWVPRRVAANGSSDDAGTHDGSIEGAEGGDDAGNGRDDGDNDSDHVRHHDDDEETGNGDDDDDGAGGAGSGSGSSTDNDSSSDDDSSTDAAAHGTDDDVADDEYSDGDSTADDAGRGVHYNDHGVDIWDGSSLQRFDEQGLRAGDLFDGGVNILLWQALTELCFAREPEWQSKRFD